MPWKGALRCDDCGFLARLLMNVLLCYVYVPVNNIGENGASQIANSLQHNSTLTTLDLGSNKIGDNGASQIVNSLQHNYTLTTLDLKSMHINTNIYHIFSFKFP